MMGAARKTIVAIASALSLVVAACSAGPEATAPVPTATVRPPSSGDALPRVAPNPGTVRVLYVDDWFGGVELMGVDAAHGRAVLRLVGRNPDRLFIDTIDIAAGKRADRWEIQEPAAKKAIGGGGFPTKDVMRDDLLRFASLIASLGPWHMRASLPSPTFATTPDRSLVLFGAAPDDGTDGDWLLAVGKDGSNPKRIDEGVIASYSPIISPDGRTMAFRGCTASPCDYGLFVAALGGKPKRVQGILGSSPPVFDKDGRRVLAIGDGVHRSRCLYGAPIGGDAHADPLFCMRGIRDASFTQDIEGRTGVVSGVKGNAGEQSVAFAWVLLSDGSVLKEETVDRATGGGILNGSGLLALPMQKGGVAIVDLINGKSAALPESDNWFFGFDTASFVGDELILLRKPGARQGYEIVSVNARALVDEYVPRAM